MEQRNQFVSRFTKLVLAALFVPFALAACNTGGGSGGGQSGSIGQFLTRPGGGAPFFVDQNQGGQATRLRLVELSWGRMVDVYDIDPLTGEANTAPILRDFVINENQPLNLSKAELDVNPITQQASLIVQRTYDAPEPSPGAGTFSDVLREMQESLPPVAPKNDDGSSPEPFSFLARNSTLILRFDDLLQDDATAVSDLSNRVRAFVGYAPTTPFSTRIVFDPNHGGISGGEFHSTRILVDMTVSEAEAVSLQGTVPVNSLGLPASLTTTGQPNVSIRIPSRIDFGSTQFAILRNLAGSPMATSTNGPIDFSSPTVDIVRAMRAGNTDDINNGFMLDLNAPQIVGGFAISVDGVIADPSSTAPGFEFLVDLTYGSICQARPVAGDIISVGNTFVEVSTAAGSPNSLGEVANIKARVLSDQPLTNPNVLLGSGLFLTTYEPGKAQKECYVSFAPQPAVLPATGVQPSSQILIRFTEPMDPASVLPFDTFLISEGTSVTANPDATNTVVGGIQPSADLREYVYTSVLPFKHTQTQQDPYNIQLLGGQAGITDLAGNALLDSIPGLDFTIDQNSPTENTGNIVLRFNSIDEWTFDADGNGNNGYNDLHGQFFYDLTNGVIRPRQALRFPQTAADRSNPVPGIMTPFPLGIQTPLSPLGSKLHAVWRYCDFGWLVDDETKNNLDVEGLYWSPVGGQVISDFYESFEIRLSHSQFLPDEWIDTNLLPEHAGSGLQDKPNPYTDNLLIDPLGAQKTVHNRALGYQVNPIDLVVTPNGTALVPFPLNRTPGVPQERFLWRDTSLLAVAGPRGNGVPLDVETKTSQNGLDLYNGSALSNSGSFYPRDQVPTIGLPLLMEFRCFPSNSGIGLNAFDINLAINSSARPNFRSFSTGGVNTAGVQISKDPDLQDVPTGGFNPLSTPPGKKTVRVADNTFYIGGIDYVVQTSSVHTVWLNTNTNLPDFANPVVEPDPGAQPAGTAVQIAFRGATGITLGTNTSKDDDVFDGQQLDAYGDTQDWKSGPSRPSFLNQDRSWKNDINDVDGAKYIQMRFNFINNVDTMLEPELSAIGVAYRQ